MAVYPVQTVGRGRLLIHLDAGRFRVTGANGEPRACFAREADLCREVVRLTAENDTLREIVDQLGKAGLDTDAVVCSCCSSEEPAGDPGEFYKPRVTCGVCGHPAMAHRGAPEAAPKREGEVGGITGLGPMVPESAPKAAETSRAEVVDLMEALKASLRQREGSGS